MSGRRPRNLAVLRASISCRAEEKVALDVGRQRCFGVAPRRVGFFICTSASHVCSFHSSHGVFSLVLANARLVLTEWCFGLFSGLEWDWPYGEYGRGPMCWCCCMVFAIFSAN
jgi:hypothetical protein